MPEHRACPALGARLKALRRKAGLTQFQAAELSKISIATYVRWELDKTSPRASELQRLCEVLGVSEAELLRGPAEEDWVLEIKAGGKEVINMDKAIGCISSVNCGSAGFSRKR